MDAAKKVDYLYSEMGVVNCIKRELGKSAESAVALGFYLDEINRLSYWKDSSYYRNFKPKHYMTPGGKEKMTTYSFYDFCKDESEGISPADVNIKGEIRMDDRKYKNRKYHACSIEYDRFISTPSMYSSQYLKMVDYLNKGYLVRMILYRPEDEDEAK